MADEVLKYRKVPAKDGDCLCGIAARFGFLHCKRVRQAQKEKKNESILNRPLRSGDDVWVPTLERRTVGGKQVEERHVFRRRGIPAPMIRFVHGSKSTPYRLDYSLNLLNISKYVSNQGGLSHTPPPPFPTFWDQFGFNKWADEDHDAFKIEVVDPKAGSNLVDVTLEALKPRYKVFGPIGSIAVNDEGKKIYESFAPPDPDSDKRSITVKCEKVGGAKQTRFRSRYLRLVVDDQDWTVLAPGGNNGKAQGLLVTDMADGNNGPNDRLEILDQRIRATYELRNCPAPAGQQKCRVTKDLPLKKDKRIKLCVHVFKESVGGANAANITEQNVRLRTKKWFRRAYAQISMAPKFVPCREGGPEIEFIDPPAHNMITISQEHGLPVSAAGGPYQLTFRLGLPPGDVALAEFAAVAAGLTAPAARPIVTVNLTNGWRPKQVAEAIVTRVAALPGGIFQAESFRNAQAFTANNRSYDVLIKRTDIFQRVMIENENLTPNAGIDIDVARVNTTSVDGNLPANWIVLNPELRRLLREAPGTDGRLDFYICREFPGVPKGFGGLGLNPHTDVPAKYRWDSPNSPMRYACFVMARGFMDGTDNWPWAYPHEAGHVLPDAFHIHNASVHASTCLMRSSILSQQHPVDASKRIFDHPVNVRYECWDPAQPAVGATMWVTGSLANRFRNRSGSVTEDW